MATAKLQYLLSIPKIIQKSPEWYAIRQGMITASDFAQALGDGKFGNVTQFYRKKCEVVAETSNELDSIVNPFFKWGNMFEAVATSIYSKLHGDVFMHEFGLIQHPIYKWFGASPDAITNDGIMVEIKCPFKRQLKDDGVVPLQYYYQIQGQLDVCDLDQCDYFECEFVEIDNEEDFYELCKDFQFWGIIDDRSATSFLYSPLNASRTELKLWKKKVCLGKPRMWVLKKYNKICVMKNDDFIKEKMQALAIVWQNIVQYRQDPILFHEKVMKPSEKKTLFIDTEPYNKNGVKPPVARYLFKDE